MPKLTDVDALRRDLEKPFPPETVKWRLGSTFKYNNEDRGLALAYIDARHVMDRLDQVCGIDNWQSAIAETASGRVLSTISIRINDEWIVKTDGAGSTKVEADKGGISDALKRAAVQWGVGRYLYGMGDTFVKVDVRGNNKSIAKPEFARLARVIKLQFDGKFDEMKREVETVHSDTGAPSQGPDKPAAAAASGDDADDRTLEEKLYALVDDWKAQIADSGIVDDLKAINADLNKNRKVFADMGEPFVSTFKSVVEQLQARKKALVDAESAGAVQKGA